MKNRPALTFIFLAYLFCYAITLGFFWTGGSITSPSLTFVLVAAMFTPAIAALIVQKFVKREPISALGLKPKFNRWILFAWFLPIGYILLTLLFSGLLPQTEWTTDASNIISILEQSGASAEEITATEAELSALGPALPIIVIGGALISALIAGVTVNMLAGMGEELGWRGLLWNEWKHLGFWKASLMIGVVWGFWHAPMIWYGYNYPESPRWGVLMMVGLTIMLSAPHSFVRERAGTTWAPAILHGTNNALGGLVPLFIIGGNSFLTNITGMAGFAALAVANLLVWWLRRRDATKTAVSAEPTPSLELG